MLETLSEDKRDRFVMILWTTWVLAHMKRRACLVPQVHAVTGATDVPARRLAL